MGTHRSWLGGPGLVDGGCSGRRGKGSERGCKGFGSGEVGGRDMGPRDGASFATCVVFLPFVMCTKKHGFF